MTYLYTNVTRVCIVLKGYIYHKNMKYINYENMNFIYHICRYILLPLFTSYRKSEICFKYLRMLSRMKAVYIFYFQYSFQEAILKIKNVSRLHSIDNILRYTTHILNLREDMDWWSIVYLQMRYIKIIISLLIIWRFILKFVAYVSLQYQAHSGNIDL